MPHTTALTGYIRFMQWFRKNHPALFHRYWKNITAPISGGEVGIDGGDLDEISFVKLMQLQFEYYHPQAS